MADASEEKRRDAALDNAPGREHFIYAIVFMPTAKCYIGQSVNPKQRLWTHKSSLRNNKHWCAELQNDWNVHGKSAFSFIIIEDKIFSDQAACEAERRHIMSSDCYNYLIVRDDDTGRLTSTDLLRKKQSDALKKAWNDPTTDLRNPVRTRWDDPDQKRIQSESQKQRYADPEQRRKTAEATRLGQTAEVRQRKSESAKAVWAKRKLP